LTPEQAVAAVEATSWARGIAEGVCRAAGLSGDAYATCVRNFKRKVALGSLGLTAEQLRVPRAPPPPPPRKPKLRKKAREKREHFPKGEELRTAITEAIEVYGDEVYWSGPPKTGVKLVIREKETEKVYISRPLTIQEVHSVRDLVKEVYIVTPRTKVKKG